ncbi:hypothetical protein Lesp02_71000 [Lentzea sp. NBRC 105346]|nr:hypothetical protein Lesp02_71000 [Lentzea sp. NBRC 105346]
MVPVQTGALHMTVRKLAAALLIVLAATLVTTGTEGSTSTQVAEPGTPWH